LVELAEYWTLDGWFFNIESNFPEGKEKVYTEKLLDFLKFLTKEMHKTRPNSLVIWYDSIIIEGKIKYQNELNQLNKAFFDRYGNVLISLGRECLV